MYVHSERERYVHTYLKQWSPWLCVLNRARHVPVLCSHTRTTGSGPVCPEASKVPPLALLMARQETSLLLLLLFVIMREEGCIVCVCVCVCVCVYHCLPYI